MAFTSAVVQWPAMPPDPIGGATWTLAPPFVDVGAGALNGRSAFARAAAVRAGCSSITVGVRPSVTNRASSPGHSRITA